MPSLHALSFLDVAATGAHYGVSSDASTGIGLIALSRLMRVKDAQILESVAASPLASAVLAALRASVLRVAVAAAGVGPGLSEANVATLFGLPGSSTKYLSQYGSFGSLQSRLLWPRFRQVVTALLDALTSARQGPIGSDVGQMLLTSTPGAPLDAGAIQRAQSAIAALIAVLEPKMQTHLASTAGASSAGSSSSEGSSHSTTPPPSQPPMPAPQAPPGPPITLVDPTASLGTNLLRLVGSRIRRAMSPPEIASVTAALDEGLSLLQSGGVDARRQLLGTSILVALGNQSGAWLWASALEAIEQPAASIAALANAIVESCSTTAAMLFADAAADFATEALR